MTMRTSTGLADHCYKKRFIADTLPNFAKARPMKLLLGRAQYWHWEMGIGAWELGVHNTSYLYRAHDKCSLVVLLEV